MAFWNMPAPMAPMALSSPRGSYLGGDMNHVYRGIHIGGSSVLNPGTLLPAGIRHVVNGAVELMTCGLVDWGALHQAGITVHHASLDDSSSQGISPNQPGMQGALQLIHQCVTSGQKVLVNCHMGISRSSSIVITYLMLYQGMGFDEALGVVRAGRYQANPNPGFVRQLQSLQSGMYGGGGGPASMFSGGGGSGPGMYGSAGYSPIQAYLPPSPAPRGPDMYAPDGHYGRPLASAPSSHSWRNLFGLRQF